MRTTKKSGPAAAATIELDPASNLDPITGAPRKAHDPAIERDYWHVNYMTRPYYKEGRSFGDYEAAYRYGWESAPKAGKMTFEEAEKAHLANGWPAARGETPHSWEDVREAVRDAWTHARQSRKP
jgi:hypothetical protein